jgi:hypothetical protein
MSGQLSRDLAIDLRALGHRVNLLDIDGSVRSEAAPQAAFL